MYDFASVANNPQLLLTIYLLPLIALTALRFHSIAEQIAFYAFNLKSEFYNRKFYNTTVLFEFLNLIHFGWVVADPSILSHIRILPPR